MAWIIMRGQGLLDTAEKLLRHYVRFRMSRSPSCARACCVEDLVSPVGGSGGARR